MIGEEHSEHFGPNGDPFPELARDTTDVGGGAHDEAGERDESAPGYIKEVSFAAGIAIEIATRGPFTASEVAEQYADITGRDQTSAEPVINKALRRLRKEGTIVPAPNRVGVYVRDDQDEVSEEDGEDS